ncbi:MAG TPA: 4a-hydroxytetrahydrobiopterin dehydratase [Nitrospirota bacterium]
MKLSEQTAKPIPKGTTPLPKKEAEGLMQDVPAWTLGEHEITREFHFLDFRESMDFVNRVAAVANEQDHHPDIVISYNRVQLTLSTHKIGGLSMNDFVLAAKIDLLPHPGQREKAA